MFRWATRKVREITRERTRRHAFSEGKRQSVSLSWVVRGPWRPILGLAESERLGHKANSSTSSVGRPEKPLSPGGWCTDSCLSLPWLLEKQEKTCLLRSLNEAHPNIDFSFIAGVGGGRGPNPYYWKTFENLSALGFWVFLCPKQNQRQICLEEFITNSSFSAVLQIEFLCI